MKKSLLVLLIVAAALTAVGLAVTTISAVALGGEIKNIVSANSSSSMNSHNIYGEFSCIDINAVAAEVRIASSVDGSIYITATETQKQYYDVSIDGDTLKIQYRDIRMWYEHVGVSMVKEKMTLYLPSGAYKSLNAVSVSGDIIIPSGYEFNSVDITSTSGEIYFSAHAKASLEVNTTSGDICINGKDITAMTAVDTVSGEVEISGINGESADITVFTTSGDVDISNCKPYALNVDSTSGEVDIERVYVTTALKIKTDSSDIELEGCDAGTLDLKAVSGNVSGVLESPKEFFTDTLSGNVNVPVSVSGAGRCECRTTSGNIKIVYRIVYGK